MHKMNLGMKIFFASELALSLRMLLFVFPAIIAQYNERGLSPARFEDWYVLALLIVSMMYFLVGVASLMGHRLWKMFHLIAFVIVLALAAAFGRFSQLTHSAVSCGYWMPLVVCSVMTGFVILFKEKS
jgi:hypothetical protein